MTQTDRENHYEPAFEGFLRKHKICYVSVNQAKRSFWEEDNEPVKSLDYVVHAHSEVRLLIDVKGRKFPSGANNNPRQIWQTWCLQEDVHGLQLWEQQFGTGYRSLLLFMFYLLPGFDVPLGTPDLWIWSGRRYLLRAVAIADYSRWMRPRSPGWKTVDLPIAAFRETARPFSCFLTPP